MCMMVVCGGVWVYMVVFGRCFGVHDGGGWWGVGAHGSVWEMLSCV